MSIVDIDIALFHMVNDTLANPIFDLILPALRSKTFWIPLYIFILSFLFYNFKWKGALIYVLFLIGTIGSADIISSHVIKKSVQRVRPCNQLEMIGSVRTLVHCGKGYSFTSSHAANHFAIASFLIFTLGRLFKRIRYPLFIWACMISFAQVYVGVHFPLDVLFGGLVGVLLGTISAEIYNRWIRSNIVAA